MDPCHLGQSFQISHHLIRINVKTVATFRPAILLAGPPNAQRLRSRTLSMESAAACLLDSPSKSLMNLTSISDSWLIFMWSSFFCPPTSWPFRCFHAGLNLKKNQHGVNCSYHIMMIMMKFWFAYFWFLPNTLKAKGKKINLMGGIVKQPQRLCFRKTACSFPGNGLRHRHNHFSPQPTLVTIYLLEYLESFDRIVFW